MHPDYMLLRTDNQWTYDLVSYLMVGLDRIFALASMTYIVDLDACELNAGNEKVFNDCINEC